SLVDRKGKILIPGMYDSVAPLSEEEKKLYEKIDFDLCEYCKDVGVEKLLHDTKEQILMHRWRYPSLSLHGIEGAFSDTGFMTVIPHKVTGKFSVRLEATGRNVMLLPVGSSDDGAHSQNEKINRFVIV
ncbi:hypothetical protein GOODEAATRI_012092, partial [Goodea atripinnis]